jgi:hypothetical protein
MLRTVSKIQYNRIILPSGLRSNNNTKRNFCSDFTKYIQKYNNNNSNNNNNNNNKWKWKFIAFTSVSVMCSAVLLYHAEKKQLEHQTSKLLRIRFNNCGTSCSVIDITKSKLNEKIMHCVKDLVKINEYYNISQVEIDIDELGQNSTIIKSALKLFSDKKIMININNQKQYEKIFNLINNHSNKHNVALCTEQFNYSYINNTLTINKNNFAQSHKEFAQKLFSSANIDEINITNSDASYSVVDLIKTIAETATKTGTTKYVQLKSCDNSDRVAIENFLLNMTVGKNSGQFTLAIENKNFSIKPSVLIYAKSCGKIKPKSFFTYVNNTIIVNQRHCSSVLETFDQAIKFNPHIKLAIITDEWDNFLVQERLIDNFIVHGHKKNIEIKNGSNRILHYEGDSLVINCDYISTESTLVKKILQSNNYDIKSIKLCSSHMLSHLHELLLALQSRYTTSLVIDDISMNHANNIIGKPYYIIEKC